MERESLKVEDGRNVYSHHFEVLQSCHATISGAQVTCVSAADKERIVGPRIMPSREARHHWQCL
jgi:hypothetical protein